MIWVKDLARRFARTQRAGLRGMPFCQWRRTSQYPRLSGQFPMYIEEQLSCSAGDRANDVMHAIADRMSDADIKAVADYAAGLR